MRDREGSPESFPHNVLCGKLAQKNLIDSAYSILTIPAVECPGEIMCLRRRPELSTQLVPSTGEMR